MKTRQTLRILFRDKITSLHELSQLKVVLSSDIIDINLSRIPFMLVYFTLTFFSNLIINDWINGFDIILRDWLFYIVIVAYWFLYFACSIGKINSSKIKSLIVYSFWILIDLYLLTFVHYDIIVNGTVYNYLIGMFLIAMLPLLSPIQSFSIIVIDMSIAVYFCNISGNGSMLTQFVIGSSLFASILSRKEFYSYLQIKNSLHNLQALSELDRLTKLYNRNILDTYVADLWQSCIDKKISLIAAMVDIDYFKNYNDTYGHAEGDFCLTKIATCIKQTPLANLCMRYGGEEFILFFSAIEPSQVISVIDDLKQRVTNLQLKAGSGVTSLFVSVSIGLACSFSEKPLSIDELIVAADKQLYNAKKNGRNCISMNDIIK